MLSIGDYKLDSRLLLAPMAGVSDYPFRQVCRHFGAGLAPSEMVTAKVSLWERKKSRQRLPQTLERAPRSMQIAGSEPEQMAAAARESVRLGAQIIDVNMGCPAKKVCNQAAGSALLKDVGQVRAILQAVVSAVAVPVTLKFRTGWSASARNAVAIARIAQACGICALVLHGRTGQELYQGYAEYETIRQVKQEVAIPVIANGDIQTVRDAAFVLEYTHADGLMIGRAAWGQPWIFAQMQDFLHLRELSAAPDVYGRLTVVLDHIRAVHAFYGADIGVRMARKHIGWYLDRITSEPSYKQGIFAITCPDKQLATIREVFLSIAPANIKKVA